MHQALGTNNPDPIRSADGRYRFELWRRGITTTPQIARGTLNCIMLNPSGSTAELSDPTVRNCELLARNWGFENLAVTNLFAYVTSSTSELQQQGRRPR